METNETVGLKIEGEAKKYEIGVMGSDSDFKSESIRCSRDAVDYAMGFYGDDILVYESVFIMLINKSNKVMGWAKISQGGICQSIVDIKIVCKYAVDTLCSGVILVHNHPSGDPRPSKSDVDVTERLKKALATLDVSLLDHVVITGDEKYYSFADEGEI